MNNKDESVMVALNQVEDQEEDDKIQVNRVKFANTKENKEDAVIKEENKDKAKIAQAMAKSLNIPVDDPQADYNSGPKMKKPAK